MDIKDANTSFKIEDLVMGKLAKQKFQVDFLPMWKFLDGWERKAGGFDKVPMKDIFEGIYEYALISVSLDKADTQTRIDNLNEQNLKWYTKADTLEAENTRLKARIAELEEGQSVQQDTERVVLST